MRFSLPGNVSRLLLVLSLYERLATVVASPPAAGSPQSPPPMLPLESRQTNICDPVCSTVRQFSDPLTGTCQPSYCCTQTFLDTYRSCYICIADQNEELDHQGAIKEFTDFVNRCVDRGYPYLVLQPIPTSGLLSWEPPTATPLVPSAKPATSVTVSSFPWSFSRLPGSTLSGSGGATRTNEPSDSSPTSPAAADGPDPQTTDGSGGRRSNLWERSWLFLVLWVGALVVLV